MKFNVLCMTSRSPNDTAIAWHVAPRAETATLTTKSYKDLGVDCGVSDVEFGGKVYPLQYVRGGLDGQSVVLGFVEDKHGSVLELYTDTPVAGSGATPETLRAKANRQMGYASSGRSGKPSLIQ